MKINEQISKIIRDNYPSRGDIKEPKLEIFTSGETYTSDPNFWEKMGQRALELGELCEETARKIEEWDEENLPNLLWLGKIRLFLTNRAIIFGWESDVFKEVKLTKLNLALLHLFLNHGGVLDKSDLCEAKKELQSIYTRIGREESEQFKDKEEDELYRGNDWFSKLVTEFNRDSLEVSERDWGRLPDHYGIKIITRNAKYDFERSKEHDYELVIPFEVHLGKEALGFIGISHAEDIHAAAAQLTRCLGHAAEIGGRHDAHFLRGRDLPVLNVRGSQCRFAEFLDGVLGIPGIIEIRIGRKVGFQVINDLPAFGQMFMGQFGFAAVDRADRVCGMADQSP